MELSILFIFEMRVRSDVYPYPEPKQDPEPVLLGKLN